MFYLIFGCYFCATAVSAIAKYPLEKRKLNHEKLTYEQFLMDTSLKIIPLILKDEFFDRKQGLKADTNRITKAEFTLLLLNTLGKLDETDIIFTLKLFQHIDIGNQGYLENEILLKVILKLL